MRSLRLSSMLGYAPRALPLLVVLLCLLVNEEVSCAYPCISMAAAPLRRATPVRAGFINYGAASPFQYSCIGGNQNVYAQPEAVAIRQAPGGELYLDDSPWRNRVDWGVYTGQQQQQYSAVAASGWWGSGSGGSRRRTSKRPSKTAAAALTATTQQVSAIASAAAEARTAAAAATRAAAMAARLPAGQKASGTVLVHRWGGAANAAQPEAIYTDGGRQTITLQQHQQAPATAATSRMHHVPQKRNVFTDVRTLQGSGGVRERPEVAPATARATAARPSAAASQAAAPAGAAGEGPAAAAGGPAVAAGGGPAAAAGGGPAGAPLKILQFSATWCGPCRRISPVVQKLSEELPSSKVQFVHVDIDENPALAEEYNVTTVPTFFFLRNGRVVYSITGGNAKALHDAVIKFMDE